MPHWTRDPATLVVLAAASYRVTRLLTTDRFPPAVAARSAVERWVSDRAPAYAHGVTCPHCIGFWVAAATTVVAEHAHRRGHLDRIRLAAAPWALATAVGVLADHEVH